MVAACRLNLYSVVGAGATKNAFSSSHAQITTISQRSSADRLRAHKSASAAALNNISPVERICPNRLM